jgi:hypothetical protein
MPCRKKNKSKNIFQIKNQSTTILFSARQLEIIGLARIGESQINTTTTTRF